MVIDFINSDLSKLEPQTDFEVKVVSFLKNWYSPETTMKVQTSGSTGTPKIIEVEKEKMRRSAERTLDFLNLKQGDTALLCLPVEYISGMMMVVRSIAVGLRLWVLDPTSNPLEKISREADFAAMTPLQVKNSLGNLSHIKKLIIGGAGVDETLKAELAKFKTLIYETYGMSETLSHIALRQIAPTSESHFSALPGVTLESSESGSLIISDPLISPEKIYTNDLVEITPENKFRFLGRTDNVINSGGLKIFPEQLEHLAGKYLQSPVIFLGVNDQILGEKLVLAIEGVENTHSNGQIEDFLRAVEVSFTKNHRPRKIVFLETFPRTPNGKVDRLLLKEKINSIT